MEKNHRPNPNQRHAAPSSPDGEKKHRNFLRLRKYSSPFHNWLFFYTEVIMKKEITTILTVLTAFGYAQALPEQPVSNLVHVDVKPVAAVPAIETPVVAKRSFGYLRLGISDSQVPTRSNMQMIPELGVGYRLDSGKSSALDFSASMSRRDFRTAGDKVRAYAYTAPKVNWLYYVSPTKDNTLYAGGGAAWSGQRAKDGSEFQGITPNLAFGYEMNRNAAFRTFIQLDVSQPAVAANLKGAFPGPFANLSLGAGF
jgi:hypothetical protein